MDNESGRRWARGGLVFGAALSLMGNVAHTFLADSTISIYLRLPLAVVWPVALFVGIETLVHVNWRQAVIDWIGRVLLWVPVGSVAAVVSYRHLHSLMQLAGEDSFSALIGPLAIDGLMMGSTVALLAISAGSLKAEPAPLTVSDVLEAKDQQTLQTWSEAPATQPIEPGWDEAWTELETEMLPEAPISPAPVSAPPVVSAPRTPRGEKSPALLAAVSALIAGDVPEIAPGASRSVVGRYAKVLRTLRSNPNAPIDTVKEKVHPELVDQIRAAMRAEAPR